jgi:LysR family transcriptional regulator, cys regulon transcriptional activator
LFQCSIKRTLSAISDWPIITYDEGLTGRIDAAFEAAGLGPQIVLTALDADVIKSNAERSLTTKTMARSSPV